MKKNFLFSARKKSRRRQLRPMPAVRVLIYEIIIMVLHQRSSQVDRQYYAFLKSFDSMLIIGRLMFLDAAQRFP